MDSSRITATLSLLRPADLWPAWKVVYLQESRGMIPAGEARALRDGIYGLMVLWGLEPDEVMGRDDC